MYSSTTAGESTAENIFVIFPTLSLFFSCTMYTLPCTMFCVPCRVSQPAAALQPGCEEMENEWGNEEEMEREWGNEEEMERAWGNRERLILYISSFSLHFLPLSPFPHSLSISHIKVCYILSQNVEYGIFVANVTKILTYALWGNNSGSNLLRGSLASCAGLNQYTLKKFNPWTLS